MNITITKKFLAKLFGYGQLVVAYINVLSQQNGGTLPTTKAGWTTLVGHVILAGGIHLSSETSAGHPNGAATKPTTATVTTTSETK